MGIFHVIVMVAFSYSILENAQFSYGIFVVDPSIVEAVEGSLVQLTIRRLEGKKAASVSYRTVNDTAGPEDYVHVRRVRKLRVRWEKRILSV